MKVMILLSFFLLINTIPVFSQKASAVRFSYSVNDYYKQLDIPGFQFSPFNSFAFSGAVSRIMWNKKHSKLDVSGFSYTFGILRYWEDSNQKYFRFLTGIHYSFLSMDVPQVGPYRFETEGSNIGFTIGLVGHTDIMERIYLEPYIEANLNNGEIRKKPSYIGDLHFYFPNVTLGINSVYLLKGKAELFLGVFSRWEAGPFAFGVSVGLKQNGN